ncbi:MAG: aquaporin [Pyrinomonadaceae bacterium]|jgi:aquaporin Z|nr:aquaporin [Pyrinomonadaceae bacterium]
MIDKLKQHWVDYLMEAAGLAGFVIIASLVTTLLEHPDSPVHKALMDSPLLRRVPLGLVMGTYIALLVYSPIGKRSGAHINPAVTAAFFRLGEIKWWDAVFYILAQFAGAIAAAQLMKVVLGRFYAHPSIHYVTTIPKSGEHGSEIAFLAEFVISFILMIVVLITINSERLEKLAGLFTGLLIAVYLVVETPYSGMSLNPARSFGSALAGRHWMDLWIYFVSPVLAMLLAAEVFRWLKVGRSHKARRKESPLYPVEQPSG